MGAKRLDRYVISRESNVVRVDFGRDPEPPPPPFPGAGAMRSCAWRVHPVNVSSTSKAEVA